MSKFALGAALVVVLAAGAFLALHAPRCRSGDAPGPRIGGVFRIEGCP